MTFKNDVMKTILGEEFSNNLELYGAILEKHRGRIEALEDNLLNIYATSKQVDSKGNIFYAPSMNPIKRASAKMELKKYKDIMAAVTDPAIARWIMTSESQIKEGQLFIDVYMGKNAEAYKTFIKKAYKDNYKLRTDTMEGKAIKAIRDYYSQYKSLLGDVAKRTLSAKQYKEFVNLYGKNGEKWLDSYGHRRLSNEMLKYYTTDKDSGKPDAHEVIYQDILSQEVGKILVKEYKKGNVDIEKMSVEELLEWGNKHTINGEIVNDIAERKGYNLGEVLYSQLFFFADPDLLVDSKMQNRIKEYNYCKTFNCSAYPSLYETPADIVDDFLVIEEEYNNCMKKQQEENKNA